MTEVVLPKLLVIGDGEHGKDTVGEILASMGFSCIASSAYCTEKIMVPYFASIGQPYPSVEACYADRMSHRQTWFTQIEAYNSPSWTRVTEEMLADGHNVYLGMRSRKEFDASRHFFDKVLWVDASKRLPPEPATSMKLSAADADIVIDNNGPLEALVGIVQDTLRRIS